MNIHEGFLELAAAAIDFDLGDYERTELDRHIAGCDNCRRTAAAYRDDAAAIASAAGPRLSPGRSVAILADTLRPPKRSRRLRNVAAAVLVVIIGAGLAAAGMGYLRISKDPLVAALPSPGPTSSAAPSAEATGEPTESSGLTPVSPAGTPRPVDAPSVGALPVRGSGQELGARIRMAPGADHDLYVSIPRPDRSVLVALLDATGHSRPGWPIVLRQATSCEHLLPVEDGSVRLLCTLKSQDGNELDVVRAYGFDSSGGQLAGWPIDLDRYGADGYLAGRVIGDELTVLAWTTRDQAQETGSAWIMTVAADAAVRNGAKVPFVNCCDPRWAIGPDRVAYGSINQLGETPEAPKSSRLMAVSVAGVTAGFPIAIDGLASEPAFDAAGRIHVTVLPLAGMSWTFAIDPDGRSVAGGSGELGIRATDDCRAIEGSCEVPAAPLVGRDGTTFVIQADTNSTLVAGVSPSGQVMPGWPYRSVPGYQGIGGCCAGEADPVVSVAAPAIGPGNVLYLLRAAKSASGGGSILAVGQDGRIVAGWPVGLKRPGSEVWSVVVAPDGTVHVLAIEPEPKGSHSATILSLTPDSTVLHTVTIIEP
jgi:hypothetical protein